MATGVQRFTSADPGAFVMTGETGKMIGVLDSTLVDQLGWTKEFSGVGQAVYRAPAGRRMYYRCLDVQPSIPTSASFAIFTGYLTMSSVSVGTNPFPTNVDHQNSGIQKLADNIDILPVINTPRPWQVIADDRTCILITQPHLDSGGQGFVGRYQFFHFGDAYNMSPTPDPYCSVVFAGQALITRATDILSGTGLATSSCYAMTRRRDGTGGGIQTGFSSSVFEVIQTADIAKMTPGNDGLLPAPNPADGRYYEAQQRVFENVAGVLQRGWLRGVWQWCHTFVTTVDALDVAGDQYKLGRFFRIYKGTYTGNSLVDLSMAFEVSDTWDTDSG